MLISRLSVLGSFTMSWADVKVPSRELGLWKALHNRSCLGMGPLIVFGPGLVQ